MNEITILWILSVHWIADFIFQTHEESINKSKSNYWLTLHVLKYTCITSILWLPFVMSRETDFTSLFKYIKVVGITFITHWITDYFTSRWTSKLYAKGDIHNFFVVIGFDQLIHYTTLLLTYRYITI